MQLRILALAAALIGAVSVPPASAQNQGKRDCPGVRRPRSASAHV